MQSNWPEASDGKANKTTTTTKKIAKNFYFN
jgi:hypothetical protein